MKGNQLEYILGSLSFALLLLSMLLFWFQASFEYKKQTLIKNTVAFTMWGANIALATMLLVRWTESGHFPLSNLYESLLFLSWSFTSIHFFLERAFYRGGIVTPTLGAVTSPMALFTNAFATFSLPQEMQRATVLVPALQSNWLMMHVSVMMISYATLLSGSLLALAYLVVNIFSGILSPSLSLRQSRCETTLTPSHVLSDDTSMKWEKKGVSTNLERTLDNLSYRSIGLGFALLTVGILSGAVWANEAWGSYWSWDPKETWAFVTWLTFALYLHTRLSHGWTGKESAFVATCGFLVVWFCYLGVNLFGKGLHSYGWFQSMG